MKRILAAFLLLCLVPAFTPGLRAGERLKAGVYLNPPFVMEETGGGYTGMAIELWEEVTDALNLHNDYILYHSIAELIQDTASGKLDVAALDLSATHERAKILKFSYPWYDSGLRIMINRDAGGSLWTALTRHRHLRMYLLFFGVFLILTLILTLMRRHHDEEFTRDWKEGLSLSFLNVVESALSGKMEQRHLGWFGNIFFIVWLLFGMAAVAYITSSMTSAMTHSRIIGDIQQAADLPGKRIGVLRGSVSEAFFVSNNEPVQSFDELQDAVDRLVANDLDAVVYGAPMLEFFVHENPDLPVMLVGDLFQPDKYCFASGYAHAELMDRATVELIRLRENKRIAELKDRFFTGDDKKEELAWPGEE